MYRADTSLPPSRAPRLITAGGRGGLLTPRRVRSLGRWTWASGDTDRPVPIALVAPPPFAGLQGPAAMRGLAESLGMRPARERIPSIGTRVRAVPGGFDVQLEQPGCILPIPAAEEVVTLAARTGALLLTVGFDLLPADTPCDALSDYVRDGVAADRVWFGSATVTEDDSRSAA